MAKHCLHLFYIHIKRSLLIMGAVLAPLLSLLASTANAANMAFEVKDISASCSENFITASQTDVEENLAEIRELISAYNITNKKLPSEEAYRINGPVNNAFSWKHLSLPDLFWLTQDPLFIADEGNVTAKICGNQNLEEQYELTYSTTTFELWPDLSLGQWVNDNISYGAFDQSSDESILQTAQDAVENYCTKIDSQLDAMMLDHEDLGHTARGSCIHVLNGKRYLTENIEEYLERVADDNSFKEEVMNQATVADLVSHAQNNGYMIDSEEMYVLSEDSNHIEVQRQLSESTCGGENQKQCLYYVPEPDKHKSMLSAFFASISFGHGGVQKFHTVAECNEGLILDKQNLCHSPEVRSTFLWGDGTPIQWVTIQENSTFIGYTNEKGELTTKKNLSVDLEVEFIAPADKGRITFKVFQNALVKSIYKYNGVYKLEDNVKNLRLKGFWDEVLRADRYFKLHTSKKIASPDILNTNLKGKMAYDQSNNTIKVNLDYSPMGANTVSDTSIRHEYGHKVMHEYYGPYDYFSRSKCGTQHVIGNQLDSACAFIEGWANFFALASGNTNVWKSVSKSPYNMETYDPTKNTAYSGALHYKDEGAVTAALYDVFDTNVDNAVVESTRYTDSINIDLHIMLEALVAIKTKNSSQCETILGIKSCLNIRDYMKVLYKLNSNNYDKYKQLLLLNRIYTKAEIAKKFPQ